MRKTHMAFVALFLVLGVSACVEPPPPTTTTTTSTSTTVPVQTLDQEFDPAEAANAFWGAAACAPPYVPDLRQAQTFTAGKTGSLDRIAVKVTQNVVLDYSAPAPLHVSIQTIDPDGTPSGTEIGSTTHDSPISTNSSTFRDVVLDHPAPVVQGEQYAIVFTESECLTPPSYYGWEFSGHTSGSTDGYAGGQWWSYVRGSWVAPVAGAFNDLAFRIWVT